MQNIPNREFVAIELPLFYKSEDSLNKIFEPKHQFNNILLKKQTKLPLKLNLDDLNCRIINGEPHRAAGILMKVRVNKKTKKVVSTEIMGKVPTIYTFDKLADFTYTSCFAPEAQTESGHLFDIDKIFNSEIKDINVIPPIFAMDSIVYNYYFNRSGKVDSEQHPMYKQASNHTSVKSCVYYDFNADIPSISPIPFNVDEEDDSNELNAILMEVYNIIKQKFDDKPIWLINQLKKTIHPRLVSKIKYVIPSIAYVYNSGPWRHCLVKYGYNPKLDKNSYIYQLIEFRIKNPEIGQQLEKYQDNNVWGYTIKRNTEIQLIDIPNSEINSELSTAELNKECDEKTGWFSASKLNKIREICKITTLSKLGINTTNITTSEKKKVKLHHSSTSTTSKKLFNNNNNNNNTTEIHIPSDDIIPPPILPELPTNELSDRIRPSDSEMKDASEFNVHIPNNAESFELFDEMTSSASSEEDDDDML